MTSIMAGMTSHILFSGIASTSLSVAIHSFSTGALLGDGLEEVWSTVKPFEMVTEESEASWCCPTVDPLLIIEFVADIADVLVVMA